MVQCWIKFAVDEEKWYLPMVLYCSGMMYKYCSPLGFFPIKHNEEGNYIHNEIFINIPYFIKNHVHVDCLRHGFFVYKNKVIICKIGVITDLPDYMIPVGLFQIKYPSLNLQLMK